MFFRVKGGTINYYAKTDTRHNPEATWTMEDTQPFYQGTLAEGTIYGWEGGEKKGREHAQPWRE